MQFTAPIDEVRAFHPTQRELNSKLIGARASAFTTISLVLRQANLDSTLEQRCRVMSLTSQQSQAGDEGLVTSGAAVADTQGEVHHKSEPSNSLAKPVTSTSSDTQRVESAPRRGGRARKPTQKSTEAENGALASEESSVPAERNEHRKKSSVSETADATKIGAEEERDEADEAQVYCVCRREDDGSFMVSCERCEEW